MVSRPQTPERGFPHIFHSSRTWRRRHTAAPHYRSPTVHSSLLYRLPHAGTAERAIFLSQLERVAVNVSRNAMPSNADNSELANRLAMQAAALEADNLDPLGLGRIDGHALSLVSELRCQT